MYEPNIGLSIKKFVTIEAVKHCTGCPEGQWCPVPTDPQGEAGRALSTDGAVGVPVHCRGGTRRL